MAELRFSLDSFQSEVAESAILEQLDEAAKARFREILANLESGVPLDSVMVFVTLGEVRDLSRTPSGFPYVGRWGNAWFQQWAEPAGEDEDGTGFVHVHIVSPAYDVLKEVDDFLSDRVGRPTQAELRRKVRAVLGWGTYM